MKIIKLYEILEDFEDNIYNEEFYYLTLEDSVARVTELKELSNNYYQEKSWIVREIFITTEKDCNPDEGEEVYFSSTHE